MTAARRRGRLRKTAARHPSGKIRQKSRADHADQMVSVALAARRHVFGLPREAAAQPRSGDYLGRLSLTGEISRSQLEAGRAYAQLRSDYDRAMLAQRLVATGDPESGPSHDGSDGSDPSYRAWVKHTIIRYDRDRRALVQCHDPLAAAVLDGIVLEDRQMWSFIGTLRLALNAIGRVLE